MVGAAGHGCHHGLKIEQFSADGHPCLAEGIAPFFNVLRDLHGKILGGRVGQDTLGAVTIAELVDGHVLEAHHVHVDLLVVLMGLVVVDGILAESLGLFLQY